MKLLTILILIVLVVVPVILMGGFIWMILLGALSHIFNVPNLAISFWQSVLVSLIFSLIFGSLGKD